MFMYHVCLHMCTHVYKCGEISLYASRIEDESLYIYLYIIEINLNICDASLPRRPRTKVPSRVTWRWVASTNPMG